MWKKLLLKVQSFLEIKENDVGRKNRNKNLNQGQFAGIPMIIIRHEVWQALNPAAVTVLLGTASRFNGINNGQIIFSCREAAEFANVSKNTAARAFILLEKLGLIKCITASNFDCRKKLAREWALTYQPIYKVPATNEWKQYKKSQSQNRYQQ